MIVALVIAVPGVLLLLLAALSSLVATHGRRSEELLVAPRGAGFGTASRLKRAADVRQPRLVAAGRPGRAVILRMDRTPAPADRRAA